MPQKSLSSGLPKKTSQYNNESPGINFANNHPREFEKEFQHKPNSENFLFHNAHTSSRGTSHPPPKKNPQNNWRLTLKPAELHCADVSSQPQQLLEGHGEGPRRKASQVAVKVWLLFTPRSITKQHSVTELRMELMFNHICQSRWKTWVRQWYTKTNCTYKGLQSLPVSTMVTIIIYSRRRFHFLLTFALKLQNVFLIFSWCSMYSEDMSLTHTPGGSHFFWRHKKERMKLNHCNATIWHFSYFFKIKTVFWWHGGVSLLTSRFSFLTMTLSGVRGHIYRNRIKPTTPMGHLKDILKEWRSPALYLPLLAVHAGPTAIHPLYS